MLQAPSMHTYQANIIRILVFLFLLIGNEKIAMSSFIKSSDMGGLNVVPGAYVITKKACNNKEDIQIDPDSRLKMQLIVRPKETYFFRRIDSKCTYMQYVKIKTNGKRQASMYFGKARMLGNCYYKPERLVASPLTMNQIQTEVKGKKLSISWDKNPSLNDCSGEKVVWKFKRLKEYKRAKNRKLARNPLYGTL